MTGRTLFRSRRWRTLRWIGLGAALPVLWACNTRTLEQPQLKPSSTSKNTFQETLNRKIDILFMIDNSSSMDQSQANLAKNLPAFMNVLKALPDGLPDLHIAVVTSDMGAGDGSITGCSRQRRQRRVPEQADGNLHGHEPHGRRCASSRRPSVAIPTSPATSRTSSAASPRPVRPAAGSSINCPPSFAPLVPMGWRRPARTLDSSARRPTWRSCSSRTRTTARRR